MSVSGISSNSATDYTSQSNIQQILQEFQQLGTDLQSGNLSGAQQDFVTLQQDLPQDSNTSPTSSSPIAQAFNQLSTDLQAGNLTAAQTDYTTLQQDLQSTGTQGSTGAESTHHHHHHDSDSSSSSESSGISQDMSQLGSALQSGNLSSAQQAYAALQKDLQQGGQVSGDQGQSATESSFSISISVSITSISVSA